MEHIVINPCTMPVKMFIHLSTYTNRNFRLPTGIKYRALMKALPVQPDNRGSGDSMAYKTRMKLKVQSTKVSQSK